MTVSLRAFLASPLALGLVGAPTPSVAKAAPAMLPVIDTHQHLWDLAKLRLPWLKPGGKPNPLAANHTPTEYARAVEGLNVVKAVYMEVDVAPEDKQKEADYVVALCESKATLTRAAVIGGLVSGDGFAAYVRPYKGHKFVKGVRQVLHADSTPAGYGLDPAFVKGVTLLGELGLSFDLCARPAELPDMAKLVGLCPGTRFVLDHCGNASATFAAKERDAWRAGMGAVAAHPNVVCKVSGFVVNAGPGHDKAEELAPVVNATVEAFGIDRVMFGGDWPVVTLVTSYKGWLNALLEVIAPRPEAERRKILHDNAAKWYGV